MPSENALSKTDDVWVVAPDTERTCVAHAITLHKPLRIQKIAENVFSTNGTPADCVLLGIKGRSAAETRFRHIRHQQRTQYGTGRELFGNGRGGKEGAFLGIPSMAVSSCARRGFLFDDAAAGDRRDRGDNRRACPESIDLSQRQYPNLPRQSIKGFMVTRLGKRIYNDNVIERIDPRGGKYYWIGGDGESYEPIEAPIFTAVEKGYVSITPLESGYDERKFY